MHSMRPSRCRRRSRWLNPRSSGLGGGGFYLLHRQADGFETMLDAREKAPGAATRDMYLDKAGNPIARASIDGPLAAGIPGEPAAFDYLARKFGKLPLEGEPAAGDSPGARGLSAVCAPAGGDPLQARAAAALARCRQGVFDRRRRRAGARRDHQAARSGAHARGHRRPGRQRVLRRAASPQDLVHGVRAGGGIWTLEDLAAYRVVERKPLVGELPRRAHRVRLAALIGRRCGVGCAQYFGGLRSRAGRFRHPQAPDRSKRCAAPIAIARCIWAIRISSRCRSRSSPSQDYAAGQRSSIRPDKAMPSDLLPGIESAPVGHADHAFLGARCRAAIAWRGRSPSICSSARATWRRRPACCSTTPWMISPSSPARRMCSAWWATPQNAIAPNKRPLVEHDADLRRDAQGPDDHRHARRQLHHQHGASGNARLPGRHERGGHRQVSALPPSIPARRGRVRKGGADATNEITRARRRMGHKLEDGQPRRGATCR